MCITLSVLNIIISGCGCLSSFSDFRKEKNCMDKDRDRAGTADLHSGGTSDWSLPLTNFSNPFVHHCVKLISVRFIFDII